MPKATDKQRHFLEILLNDCGYSTLVKRRDFYKTRTGRDVRFTDEITVSEASRMIEELKSKKQEEYANNHPETFEEPWEPH